MQLETPAGTDGAHRWVALGASVVGSSHLARAVPCQDAHAGVVLDDGTLLLAVADGAGSARYAAEGSARAAQACLGFVAHQLAAGHPADEAAWRELLLHVLAQTRGALDDLAAEVDGATVRDLATTLLLAVLTPTVLATLQVGDGAIVLRSGEELHVLSPPAVGEYINETTFITSADAVERVLIAVNESEAVDALAIFSDGVQMLALELSSNTAHAPFFAPLFTYAAHPDADTGELTAMLSSDRVNERTDDDKTLVLAVRTSLTATA